MKPAVHRILMERLSDGRPGAETAAKLIGASLTDESWRAYGSHWNLWLDFCKDVQIAKNALSEVGLFFWKLFCKM